MKRFLLPCSMTAMLFAVVSCTGSAKTVDSPGGAATYMANSKSEIAFIQWRTTKGGQVQGTLTADNIGGAAPAASLSVNSVPFTGIIHGTVVNLTFAHGLFLQSQAHGSLTGSNLTLAVPHADGTIHVTTFTQSSRSSYNRAVATLRSSAQHENLLAGGSGSHPSANSRALQHNAQRDFAALYQDSSLAPQAKLTQDVNHFAADAATARSRLAKEKQDAAGDNHYCAAASTAVGDSRGVNGALLAAVGDSESLTADINAIRMGIQATGTDMRRLSRSGLPEPTSAPELIANAKASMAQAVASANSYIDQLNAVNNQARVTANRMATGKCSGAGQSPFTHPVGHIK